MDQKLQLFDLTSYLAVRPVEARCPFLETSKSCLCCDWQTDLVELLLLMFSTLIWLGNLCHDSVASSPGPFPAFQCYTPKSSGAWHQKSHDFASQRCEHQWSKSRFKKPAVVGYIPTFHVFLESKTITPHVIIGFKISPYLTLTSCWLNGSALNLADLLLSHAQFHPSTTLKIDHVTSLPLLSM